MKNSCFKFLILLAVVLSSCISPMGSGGVGGGSSPYGLGGQPSGADAKEDPSFGQSDSGATSPDVDGSQIPSPGQTGFGSDDDVLNFPLPIAKNETPDALLVVAAGRISPTSSLAIIPAAYANDSLVEGFVIRGVKDCALPNSKVALFSSAADGSPDVLLSVTDSDELGMFEFVVEPEFFHTNLVLGYVDDQGNPYESYLEVTASTSHFSVAINNKNIVPQNSSSEIFDELAFYNVKTNPGTSLMGQSLHGGEVVEVAKLENPLLGLQSSAQIDPENEKAILRLVGVDSESFDLIEAGFGFGPLVLNDFSGTDYSRFFLKEYDVVDFTSALHPEGRFVVAQATLQETDPSLSESDRKKSKLVSPMMIIPTSFYDPNKPAEDYKTDDLFVAWFHDPAKHQLFMRRLHWIDSHQLLTMSGYRPVKSNYTQDYDFDIETRSYLDDFPESANSNTVYRVDVLSPFQGFNSSAESEKDISEKQALINKFFANGPSRVNLFTTKEVSISSPTTAPGIDTKTDSFYFAFRCMKNQKIRSCLGKYKLRYLSRNDNAAMAEVEVAPYFVSPAQQEVRYLNLNLKQDLLAYSFYNKELKTNEIVLYHIPSHSLIPLVVNNSIDKKIYTADRPKFSKKDPYTILYSCDEYSFEDWQKLKSLNVVPASKTCVKNLMDHKVLKQIILSGEKRNQDSYSLPSEHELVPLLIEGDLNIRTRGSNGSAGPSQNNLIEESKDAASTSGAKNSN